MSGIPTFLLNAIEEIGARVERLDAHTARINGSLFGILMLTMNLSEKYVHLII